MRRTNRLALWISLAGLLVSCAANSTLNPQTFEVSELVKNANTYIKDNISTVDTTFKNTYHLTPPVGWCNDPNGFSEFNDKYHLFYQYNPYQAEWGPMHWGHQTTEDFIKWELEDVALAPDMDYDNSGCFSGTALVEDNKHYLAYTAVTEFQNQGIAYSEDGVTYKKLDDLVLSGDDLPEGFSNNDFRDPKIFKRDNKFYMLVGNKNNNTNQKQVIMFKANEVTGPYEYAGVVYSRNDLGGIFECPDLITIDGKDILIVSPQSMGSDDEYSMQNTDSCVYLVGNLSTNTNKFYMNKGSVELEEFDKGFSFYAPQTMTTSDGRSIMVAWMRSWSEPNLTKADGWCGAMTLPRELSLKDGHIYQAPVREINNYLRNMVDEPNTQLNNEVKILEQFSGNTSRITLDICVDEMTKNGRAGIEVLKGLSTETKIYYDNSIGCVVLNRDNCGSLMSGSRYCKVEPINGKIKLEIYLDINSVEVFVNDGYYTMTGTTFSNVNNVSGALFAKNTTASFENITKQDIIVE